MRFKLIWSGIDAAIERPENFGLEAAIRRLTVVSPHAVASPHTVAVIDASSMTDEQRFSVYLGEAVPASRRRYKVARVFGSRRRNGEDFGRGVPALIAYMSEADSRGADVFPHEASEGRIVTIADGLSMFGFR